MNELPASLRRTLENALGVQLGAGIPVDGGMINRAVRVETSSGPIFVKWKDRAPAGFFEAEADGLERLRGIGALRVPLVLALGGEGVEGKPAFLALEYVAPRPPVDPVAFARRFGEGLATLHRQSASPAGQYGLDREGFIGSLPQTNAWRDNWPAFYRECRLLPQIEIARRAGRLPAARERLLERVLTHLVDLMAGFSSSPALIHGDLWAGNFLAAGDEPVVVDPAVYYAEREVEIAYIELFGGFPNEMLTAYEAAYPLDEGYARRLKLHQLYPLLVHLNHFGETYGPKVEGACLAALRATS